MLDESASGSGSDSDRRDICAMSNAAINWLSSEVDLAALEGPSTSTAVHDDQDMVLELSLADLVQDAGGEVVLYNDSGLRALGLVSDALVVREGEASAHVTASGDDVTGFRYVSFANGLTLYYQDGLDLVVRSI